MTATFSTKAGEKIPVSPKYETEITPTVWVQLVRGQAAPFEAALHGAAISFHYAP